MLDVHFPSWTEAGLTPKFVQLLHKACQDADLLESVVSDRVFHLPRSLQYVYVCGVCGHSYKAKKIIDDYGTCEKCGSRAIYCTQHLKNMVRKATAASVVHEDFAADVIKHMQANFAKYFEQNEPEDIVNIRWKQAHFHAQFLGGICVGDANAYCVIVKASIFCPWLWDVNFDWKTGVRRAHGVHLTPILHDWCAYG